MNNTMMNNIGVMNNTMLNLNLDTDSFSGISQARLKKKMLNTTMREQVMRMKNTSPDSSTTGPGESTTKFPTTTKKSKSRYHLNLVTQQPSGLGINPSMRMQHDRSI